MLSDDAGADATSLDAEAVAAGTVLAASGSAAIVVVVDDDDAIMSAAAGSAMGLCEFSHNARVARGVKALFADGPPGMAAMVSVAPAPRVNVSV